MKMKGRRIEVVSEGPFTAEIKLTQDGTFFCNLGECPYTSRDKADVAKWARKWLRDHNQLTWTPVLEVSWTHEDTRCNYLDHSVNLDFYIERYYVAYANGTWVECPWAVRPVGTYLCSPHNPSNEEQQPISPEELAQARVSESKAWYHASALGPVITWPLAIRGSMSRTQYVVPYTEATWGTMLGLMEKVRELRASVEGMLATDQGWQQLAVVATQKLLT